MEHVFAPTRAASALSLTSQRRILLLQAVLPSFSQAAAQLYYASKAFSSTKDFWTKFLAPCILMDLGGWKFDRLDDRHENLLKRSLQCLESVVLIEKADTDEAHTSSPFPRLVALKTYIKNNKRLEEDESVFGGIMKLTKPTDPHSCIDIIRTLNELADVMEDNSKQPSPEGASVASKMKPLLAPVLLDLFSTISKCFQQCRCAGSHKAILLLFTHRAVPENGLHSFKLLLTRGITGNRWKEAVITVKEQLPEPQVRIVPPGSTDELNEHTSISIPVSDLCSSIEMPTTSPLNLRIDHGALYQQTMSAPIITKVLSDGMCVSLSEGLLKNENELDINGQICLAVVLSYSLLDFCGESWFPSGWTKDGIYLLQHDQHLSLRPALIACVRPSPVNTQTSRTSSDLKLLFHGILLMEIFRQEALPIKYGRGKTMNIIDLRRFALKEFETMKTRWGVCERYRQSVQACLEGVEVGESLGDETESFAIAFYQKVISPLETDYTSLWGNRDPDEAISEVKLLSVKRKKPPPLAPKPAQFQLFKSKSSGATRIPGLSPRPLRFFDTVDSPEQKQIEGARRWFNLFDHDDVQAQLPKITRDKGKRIKIAVLDTGINMNNPWILQKCGRIQCWPNNEACEDTDGHGTQIAYLLLRLVPRAHLRIVKVAKSRLLKDVDVEDIAKAIHHFSSDPSNRVDIINLSFGFPKFHSRLQPILDAIRVACQNSVTIFAAAGNEGGNQEIFWPAKLHETGDVICINGADSDGNASSFNPTTSSNNRICTLGEALPSCETDTQGEIIHRSGTSFATPIAVATAAIVLTFVETVAPHEAPPNFNQIKARLRTKSGMEKILHTMCVLSEEKRRMGYSYITPWFFLSVEERLRVHILANELRSIPE